MTKRKRLLTSALFLVLLSAAAAVPAGISVVHIKDLVLDGFGETNARRLPGERIRVDTRGLAGTMTVDCGGDPRCLAVTFDGSDVGLSLSLRLNLEKAFTGTDTFTYTVIGRARGFMLRPFGPIEDVFGFTQADLQGEVTGSAACPPNEQPPCTTMALILRIRAILRDDVENSVVGITELRLEGTLARTGREVQWILLGGEGEYAPLVNMDDLFGT